MSANRYNVTGEAVLKALDMLIATKRKTAWMHRFENRDPDAQEIEEILRLATFLAAEKTGGKPPR